MLVSSRRMLLGGVAALASAASLKRWWPRHGLESIPTSIKSPKLNFGHLLRDAVKMPPPREERRVKVAIVGGGIAGLSAAWWLKRSGLGDFALLDLEEDVGGNSRSGKNRVSEFPLGAHYLPLPGEEARYVQILLEEMGVIKGRDAFGKAIYDETVLCASPRERLFIHGRWQDGLIPSVGLSSAERRELDAFFDLMAKYREARGSDGRRAFVIPLDLSSRDERFTSLDQKSMTDLLSEHGLNSKPLRWYVDYCCRDDFGTTADDTSAWAGVHYFASRHGDDADDGGVLTWPDGNGRIVKHLAGRVREQTRPRALVFNVEPVGGDDVIVDYLDVDTKASHRIRAEHVIFAAPRFVAPFVIAPWRKGAPEHVRSFSYTPWVVANLTLRAPPASDGGAPLSWDNVRYGAATLGYVVATHQALASQTRETVITHYRPLADEAPKAARERMQKVSAGDWRREIIDDLSRVHRGIAKDVESIDVWLWGHGMIRPVPNFIWGKARQEALAASGPIEFAHSDMSGISIFEEAQFRGVEAAKRVLGGAGA